MSPVNQLTLRPKPHGGRGSLPKRAREDMIAPENQEPERTPDPTGDDAPQTASAPQGSRERSLERQLAFQTLVARLSTDFIRLSSAEIDGGIGRALETISRFANVDRAVLALYGQGEFTRWRVFHEWHTEGLQPLSELFDGVSAAEFGWTWNELRAGHPVVFSDPSELPEYATAERGLLGRASIRSVLFLPVFASDRLVGFTAFGSGKDVPPDTDELIELSRLVSRMFVNALERKRTEEAQRTSEAHYRSLFESNVVGIAIVDYDGRLIECNDGVLRTVGATREDLEAGLQWDAFTPPEYRGADERAIEEVRLTGSCGPYEKEVVRPNGNRSTFMLGGSRIEGRDDRFIAVAVDITSQKRAEAQLRYRSEAERLTARLSRRFLNLPYEGIDAAIDDALLEIGTFVGIERATVYRFTDSDRRLARRTHEWHVVPAPPGEEDPQTFDMRDFPWALERFSAGEVIYAPDVSAMTDPATAERSLLLGLGVVTTLAVPLMLGGIAQGFMVFSTVGHPRTWREDDIALVRVMAEIIGGAQARGAADEKVARLTAELEERVRVRTAQLEASNRELEAFSYSVSHDLRTPLRAIDGFSEVLLEEHGDRLDAGGHEVIARIRRGTQRLGELIDALLQLSRITRAEMTHEAVDLSALARRVVERTRTTKPRAGVEVTIAPDLEVRAQPRLLELLLQNLIENAWKFTGKRAEATIEVGRAAARVRRDEPAPYFVRDNGVGFDPDYADNLFGAFQRLHAADEFEGYGIGLATVERIVALHGGRVWAEGQIDRGATVYFTLGHGDPTS